MVPCWDWQINLETDNGTRSVRVLHRGTPVSTLKEAKANAGAKAKHMFGKDHLYRVSRIAKHEIPDKIKGPDPKAWAVYRIEEPK